MSRWRKAALSVLCAVALCCVGMLALLFGQERAVQKQFSVLRESAPAVSAEKGRDLSVLQAQNPDCVGWIEIEGTNIDYPVMYTPTEPQRYLRKGFDGKYAHGGVPFIDARCDIAEGNLIVYGHNLLNGRMFSELENYADPAWRKAHSEITLQMGEQVLHFTVGEVIHGDVTDSHYYTLESSDTRELVLSTCEGSKQQRLLVIATLNP